jgi:polyhydroxyalkanoate synthesis regulator protein
MAARTEPILNKRYAKSRLYDATSARYLPVADLRSSRARGIAFTMREAGANADITRILSAEPS